MTRPGLTFRIVMLVGGGDKGAAGVHLKSGLAPRRAEVDAELLFQRR